VDWTSTTHAGQEDLDVLVIDMPPGTGDVQLSLGQLVIVDGMSLRLSYPHKIQQASRVLIISGAVIVSTPQDVALVDARKGVAMFRKVSIPVRRRPQAYPKASTEISQIIGLLLNMSHFTCSACTTPHELFGSSAKFEGAARDLSLDVLGGLD
jgi:ATP-binding protein involved in chromosome partitioning